jgi:hypothetical protein
MGSFGYRLAGVLWIASLYASLGHVLARVRESGRLRVLMSGGLAACALGYIVFAGVIMTEGMFPDAEMPLIITGVLLSAVAIYLAVAGLLASLRPLSEWARWVRGVAIVLSGLLTLDAVLLIIIAIMYGDSRNRQINAFLEFGGRSAGVLGILVGCAIAALAAGVYFRRLASEDPERPDVERLELRITCPRCDSPQVMQTEGDHCRACGLSITVSVA